MDCAITSVVDQDGDTLECLGIAVEGRPYLGIPLTVEIRRYKKYR